MTCNEDIYSSILVSAH